MSSARLKTSGGDWIVVILGDWSSDLGDRLRRAGSLNSKVLISVKRGDFEGEGRVEYHADAGDGTAEVWVVGQSSLEPSLPSD
jgi:hypothetical protein